MYKLALVHGRFQPPHLGHEYLARIALSNAEQVVILVGNTDRVDLRHPYSFHEIHKMWETILADSLDRVVILASTACLDTDSLAFWTQHMYKTLQDANYIPDVIVAGPKYTISRWKDIGIHIPVIHVPKRHENISATDIREKLAHNESLAGLVNPKIIPFLMHLDTKHAR